MTNEELINQRKKEITELTSQIDKSKINYNLPMGSWVSNKESEISDRERMTIKEAINQAKIEMLTELQSEIEGLPMYYDPLDISDLIQEKINVLKENEDE